MLRVVDIPGRGKAFLRTVTDFGSGRAKLSSLFKLHRTVALWAVMASLPAQNCVKSAAHGG